METRDLIILCIWAFVALIWVGYLWIGQVMEFFGAIILLVIALGFSIVVVLLLPPGNKISTEKYDPIGM